MIEMVEILIDEKTLKELKTNTRYKYFLYDPVQAPKTPHNQREQQTGVIDMQNNKTPSKRKKKAFTVIELLFAVAIISVVVIIAAALFDDIQKEIDETINCVEQYHEIVEEYANK